MELTEAEKYWRRWVLKPEQEKYRGKELKLDEMWQFAEDYHQEQVKNNVLLHNVSKCLNFENDKRTSSATMCLCGKEKWQH